MVTKIMIAVPSYGGSIKTGCTTSLLALKHILMVKQIDRSDILVYTKDDLDQIRRVLNQAALMLFRFRYYLNPIWSANDDEAAADPWSAAGALRLLSKIPLFQESLARVRESRKNNPQSQNG